MAEAKRVYERGKQEKRERALREAEEHEAAMHKRKIDEKPVNSNAQRNHPSYASSAIDDGKVARTSAAVIAIFLAGVTLTAWVNYTPHTQAKMTYGTAAMMTEAERQRVYDEGIRRQNETEQKRKADREYRAANAATWIGTQS